MTVDPDFDDELRNMATRALASIEVTKQVPTRVWAARIARGNDMTTPCPRSWRPSDMLAVDESGDKREE